MAYDPRLVANALLRKAREHGENLTHLKLQKLMFFVQAWGLALRDDEVVTVFPEAWDYGPVFPPIYHELKGYGSRPIMGYLVEPFAEKAMVPSPQDRAFYELIDKVWDRYGALTAGQLSSLSHTKGGPWDVARQSDTRNISRASIAQFYRQQLNAV